MATLYIDNVPYEVKEGKNLLETCLSLGFDLPYFCWHPAMGSVGACRQCAIKIFKDENDTTGRIIMSCMEPVGKETRISVQHADAKNFRKQIIEWLMTNHPHDCAVCDEGGSCHLQDMTVMAGHNYRRFDFPKRTYNNQYLGPFINHEMNRCIQCYRCLRFYKDYAGGKDLDVYAAHNHVYFGREADGVLESEFSGNLAEVCPTGVFTDKTLKGHYTRKWDFTFGPSICHHCSLGCNIIAGERYGELRQITARFNGDVNGYFICDRGRFGYEVANSPQRLQEPYIKEVTTIDQKFLLNHLSNIISSQTTIGVGSPRASLESNFVLQQLVGKENFYSGLNEKEAQLNKTALSILQSGVAKPVSLKEIETCDCILILGEDLTNTAPMAALYVRQAIQKTGFEQAQERINLPDWHDAALREFTQEQKGDLYIFHPHSTKMDDLATKNGHLNPSEITSLAFSIADELQKPNQKDQNNIASSIAESLLAAKKPLIISGTSLRDESILKAASNIALTLKNNGKEPGLFLAFAECNSAGLALMDAPAIEKAFEVVNDQQADCLIILENDLFKRMHEKLINETFNQCKEIIVLDHLKTATSEKATITIPVGLFSEADGTLINNELRAQRFFQAFIPKNNWIEESWRWLHKLYSLKNGLSIDAAMPLSTIQTALIKFLPQFEGIDRTAPTEKFRINGQKIPSAPHRYSGRTAIQTNQNVSELKPLSDNDSPLSFTMEGYKSIPPSSVTPFFWSPGWNSVQSINKFQIEVGGPLHDGNPGVPLKLQKTPSTFYPQPGPEFNLNQDEWLAIPAHHIYGSEELSSKAPAIAELTPYPYLAMNKASMNKLGMKENDAAIFELNGRVYELLVKLRPEIKNQTVLLPFGLSGLGYIELPSIIKEIRKKQ